MRAPTLSILRSAPAGSAALAIALTVLASPPLYAQRAPGGFSLPEPTPSPTSAPQGPADERAGVQIGPRIIRQADPSPTPEAVTPSPQPTPAPTPTPTPTATPTSSATAAASPARTSSETPQRPARTTSTSDPSQAAATDTTGDDLSDRGDGVAAGTRVPLDPEIGPGFDTLPDSAGDSDPIGPDEWNDVDTAPAEARDYTAQESFAAMEAWDSTRNRIIGGVALLLILIAAVAVMIWRRRRQDKSTLGGPSPALASGVRQSMANQMPSLLQDAPDWAKGSGTKGQPKTRAKVEVEPAAQPDPVPVTPVEPRKAHEPSTVTEPEPAKSADAKPAPAAPVAPVRKPAGPASVEPTRLDLELEIVGATRSFMMFTVEFSLDISNRTDHAVRDLAVMAKLSSVRQGVSEPATSQGGQPVAQIERIGPHQSQRISGTLQMPLSEVVPIRQGSKPLMIPLLDLTIEGNGREAINRSFVLGTPSATGAARVHPLPLDGPPGGLPQLRAQEIRQPQRSDTQSTETA